MQGVHCQERHLFLFNDLLLVAKAKSGSNFKLKDKVRISEIWLNESPAVIDEVAEISKSSDTSFVIGWPTTNYVAVFRLVLRTSVVYTLPCVNASGVHDFFLLLCKLGMWSLSGVRTLVLSLMQRVFEPYIVQQRSKNICIHIISSLLLAHRFNNRHNNNSNMLITSTHWNKRYCISEKEVRYTYTITVHIIVKSTYV